MIGARGIMLLALVSVFVGATSALADEAKKDAPWQYSCREFKSSRHFVRASTVHCLRQADQKSCQAEAQKFFERCRFSGDFHRMSARIGARMLLVLAFSSVRSVNHLDL